MRHDLDVLVAGAGAAGLSLAVRLATQTRLRVRVLEARPGPSDDRTFCFFRGRAHPFEPAITRRYDTVVVRDEHSHVRRSLGARPYEELPGLAFAEHALALLAPHAERVHVAWGHTVSSFTEQRDGVAVQTSEGRVTARLFVDARGAHTLAHVSELADEVRWLQHFVGHVVRTERPIFEPGVATLMDFDVAQDEGPHFVYVLPSSPTVALVEDTYFSASVLPRARYEAQIDAWLARHGAGEHEVLRREAGRIPMTTVPQARAAQGRVVVIGQRGGAAKASSGYAFQFIQRQCDALAEYLRRAGLEAPLSWQPPRSHVASFLDRVMLAHLRRHPREASRVFVPLFRDVPAEALARFLSEEAGLTDHVRVMNAVPRLPVAHEALRSRALWLRGR